MVETKITVTIEEGQSGLWFATSPDMNGLLVAEKTRDDAERVVPEAIRDMYKACDIDVVVSKDSATEWTVASHV